MIGQGSKIKIVADEMLSLAWLPANFPVELQQFPGREIDAGVLGNCEALLVRSVTQVNAELLAHSSVRFVGTATIGTDHIDLDYLQSKEIAFAHAPGCNANAVVDYVMASIFEALDEELREELSTDAVIGVVGYGNVGSRLAACLDYWGFGCRVYDPLVRVPSKFSVNSIDQILECQVVSFHVPLTQDQKHRTFHYVNSSLLKKMQNVRLLLNTSRGEVVCNRSLNEYLRPQASFKIVLDVWENEPEIGLDLMRRATLATGHIAGYSQAGKLRGVAMVLKALFDFFSIAASDEGGRAAITDDRLSSTLSAYLNLNNNLVKDVRSIDSLESYRAHLLSICPVEKQSLIFKSAINTASEKNKNESGQSFSDLAGIASSFDAYRKQYELRKETDYTTLLSSKNLSKN